MNQKLYSAGQKILKERTLLILLIFVVLMSFLSPNFLTTSNILNVMRQASTNGLIAFGMTLVVLTAGIDLSVGSILAFTGVFTAYLLQSNIPGISAMLIGALAGTTVGILNGAIIAYGKLQPFIATLGTMTVLRGLTLVISKGRPLSIAGSSTIFAAVGNAYLLGIPIPVYLLFISFLVIWFILNHTVMGKYIYALGGNERASYIAGIRNSLVKIFVYGASGFFATLSGFILVSRLSSAQPTLGIGFELDAIAAVVIGGTPLSGGRGRIFGTLLGAIIIGVLNNSLNLMGVSSFYQQVIKGLVILLAVLLDLKNK